MTPDAAPDRLRVGGHLACTRLSVHPYHVDVEHVLDGSFPFTTRVQYEDLDLRTLAERHPPAALRRVWCHMALFEGMKYLITLPRTYDVTAIADGLSRASLDAFREWAPLLWSQHLFENGIDDWDGPEMVADGALGPGGTAGPIDRGLRDPAEHVLAANGGGKDSFLVMDLLGRAGVRVSAYHQARSEYGRFDVQHRWHENVLSHLPHVVRRHRIAVVDPYTDAVFAARYAPDLRGEVMLGHPCQVGAPEMLFNAVPLALAHGYTSIALGNERSADVAQARWESSGAPVNHQYLKSHDAERRFDALLRSEVVADLRVFSLLRPLYDARIYALLGRRPDILPDVHSCNVEKPWCRRCPKCAYVFAQLSAEFGLEPVRAAFGADLFASPHLGAAWRELLGLADHNAFECVGSIGETRMAFRRCVERGARGPAIDVYLSAVHGDPSVPWAEYEATYRALYDDHSIPPAIWERVRPLL